MKRMLSLAISLIVICSINPAMGQDPGDPDSLIFGSVEVAYAPGQVTYAEVPVYFVTDDSVADFMMPIKWTNTEGGITPIEISWDSMFDDWADVYDSIRVGESYIHCSGFRDLGDNEDAPFINTGGVRHQVATITFEISGDASEQYTIIDSALVSAVFMTTFGLYPGNNDVDPMIVSGMIQYGSPTGVDDEPIAIPSAYSLNQNYPNPFNPETSISFTLPHNSFVKLSVYNILGQNVNTLIAADMAAGTHQVRWDGANELGEPVPSGIYFYSIKTDEFSETRKMMMLK